MSEYRWKTVPTVNCQMSTGTERERYADTGSTFARNRELFSVKNTAKDFRHKRSCRKNSEEALPLQCPPICICRVIVNCTDVPEQHFPFSLFRGTLRTTKAPDGIPVYCALPRAP